MFRTLLFFVLFLVCFEPQCQGAARSEYSFAAENFLGRAFINTPINEWGETPLYRACENRHDTTINMLLWHGAEIDLPMSHCLHFVCGSRGDKLIVKRFLAHSTCRVNAQDEDGRTPLHFAAHFGNHDIVKLLLKQPGVALNICNRHGDTPLDEALNAPFSYTEDYKKTIELITQAGGKTSPELKDLASGIESP